MKKPVLLVVLVALFLSPPLCLASYLVQLTNGNQFITHGYWEDGIGIRFYSGEGTVALPKASIQHIRETDRPVTHGPNRRPVIFMPRAPQRVPEAGAPAEKPVDGIQKAGAVASLADLRHKRQLLQAALDQALERFREASGRGDLEAKKTAVRRITEASGEMLRLADDLSARNNGVLPPWWEKGSPSHRLLPAEKL